MQRRVGDCMEMQCWCAGEVGSFLFLIFLLLIYFLRVAEWGGRCWCVANVLLMCCYANVLLMCDAGVQAKWALFARLPFGPARADRRMQVLHMYMYVCVCVCV